MIRTNVDRKLKRKKRVSENMVGTKDRPRISIHRTNKYIYAQAIDDTAEKTVASYNSILVKAKGTKSDKAKEVGKKLAEILKGLKIDKAIFDRSRFTYNGRVKALAEGLREGEIQV
jgi:large subunit ribosomal protein L18